MLITCTANSEN